MKSDYEFPILNADDPDFAEKFAEAIGAKPGDTLEIFTPQFEREGGVRPVLSVDDWDKLRFLSVDDLKTLGCRPWSEPDADGNGLMLFPAEWYPLIPDGYRITSILGHEKVFVRGKTDDDKRGGVLAYGIKVRAGSLTTES